MLDNRSTYEKRLASILRYYLWYNSKNLKIHLVAEFPKSGGTWLTQVLSEVMEIDYPRNQTPKLKKHQLLHGHHYQSHRFNKPVCVVRDGRDVMVSYYHHLLLGSKFRSAQQLKKKQSEIGISNPENVEENLSKFIEYMFSNYKAGLRKMDWASFNLSYVDSPAMVVKYEDMLHDQAACVREVLDYWNVELTDELNERVSVVTEKFTFQNQAKRKPGEENKSEFLRKGIAGDWKNHFNEASEEVFFKYAEGVMRKLNYL